MVWLRPSTWFSPTREQQQYRKEIDRLYRAVFLSDDGQAVLTDLATLTRFYQASDPVLSEREAGYADGMKAVYARIHSILTLTETERGALETAVREELLAQQGLNEEEDF